MAVSNCSDHTVDAVGISLVDGLAGQSAVAVVTALTRWSTYGRVGEAQSGVMLSETVGQTLSFS